MNRGIILLQRRMKSIADIAELVPGQALAHRPAAIGEDAPGGMSDHHLVGRAAFDGKPEEAIHGAHRMEVRP